MIARMWRGWVRTEDRDAYAEYIEATGMAEYRRTPGNRGAHMLTRDLGDGRTEIVTLSFWESRDAVSGFAGEDVSRAVFYPEDDRYLVDREVTVSHYEVHGQG
ncbi:heme-degrading monooxygenase HmoA [Geodermatophilus bullaregiensis]|uniref:antibiotic biosynthesis monooxygenase family protein n=1 Tax=Geodermatophilus bullaregiensis TaxID=1564160 RepID=UPI00195B6055|nr:antibiotic biosynthesis monooxygenase [Geodermatophilus bullaregiensis]MBM7808140.1 heme-degrading monooxygenase HmoA [Geodermatophilus bullaregiensis]